MWSKSTVVQGIALALCHLAVVDASAIVAPAAVPALPRPEITAPAKLEVRDVSPQGYTTFWHAISSINGQTSYSLDSCSAGSTISSSGTNWHCCPVTGTCNLYTQCINGILYAASTAVTCGSASLCASVFLLNTVGDNSAPLTWPGCDASTAVGQFSQYFLFSPGATIITTSASSSSSASSTSSSGSSSSSSSSGGGGGGGSKTNVGAIVGGVIGGLALVGAVVVGGLFFCLRSRRNRQNEAAAAAASLAGAGTLGQPSPQTNMSTVSPDPSTAHQSTYFQTNQQGGFSYPHGYAPVQQGYQQPPYYAPYVADPSKTSPGGSTVTPAGGPSPHVPYGAPNPNAPVELVGDTTADYPQQPHLGAVEVQGSDVIPEKSA